MTSSPGYQPPDPADCPAMQSLAVIPMEEAVVRRARDIAHRLNLPLVTKPGQHAFLLRLSSERLELLQTNDPALTGAVSTEFVKGKAGYRRRRAGGQMLVQAVRGKKYHCPLVIDATGGLGSDAFLLATACCRVFLFEQHPVLALLLEDGLRRAAMAQETEAISQRIHLRPEKFTRDAWFQGSPCPQVDVVYLDPMFPERKKTARVKKGLQMLQMLVGTTGNTEKLLHDALSVATRRVVVKRPRKGPFLADRRPSFSLTGRTTRFDVYQLNP